MDRKTLIDPIQKNKTDAYNYRGVALVSVAFKILSKAL